MLAKFRRFRPGRGIWIFLFRNLLLYFLLFNAYLHLRRELDFLFLSIVFVLAVLMAVWMEKVRLRFWPAILLALISPVLLRFIFFLTFGMQRAISPGPDTDFLYFFFDKDFFPSLLPFFIVWLFNFWALRFPSFIYPEAGFNALILIAIFWSEARYRISLYPHPSLFAVALFAFLFGEILVLMLGRMEAHRPPLERPSGTGPERAGPAPGSWKTEARSFLSFMWLLIPLLVILLFFLLGRFNEGAVRLGGGLMKPTLFRFDFSQFIKLESDIEMSDGLVLLFRKEGPAKRILLRRFILSGYDKKRGFYHINKRELENLPTTVTDKAEEFIDPEYLDRSDVRQEYFFVNFDPTSLIGMNYPVKVTPLKNWDASSFLRIYRVFSRVSRADPAGLVERDAEGLTARQRSHYTDYGNDEGIKELSESITGGLDNYYSKVSAIRDYLKSNYFYSLKPGLAADGDQLAHFLFNSQKGYCSYFAFAMALLCRSIGIPARVAVGFYVDPDTEVLNFYEVRAYQAHAWVEVFFYDYGWIEFDPSSTEIAPGEEFYLQFGFDFENLSRLIEEILRNQDKLQEETGEQLTAQRRISGWGSDLVKGLAFIARIWYITLPLLYLLGISAVKLYPYLLFGLHSGLRRKIKHLYHFSLVQPCGLGLVRRPEESIMEYGSRLENQHSLRILPWTDYFLRSVFSKSFSKADYGKALENYRGFLASFRQSQPPWVRVLAYFNPLNSLRRRG
ncbi:hypothetical protein ES703_13191 [subsurface metagenome]